MRRLLSAAALLFAAHALFGYNPKELFTHLETVSFTKHPALFHYFETDFDSDGKSELWIAHDKSHVGGNGLYFHVYGFKEGRYEMLEDTPSLDPHLLAFAKEGASEKDGRVISYFRYSSEHGALVSFRIESGRVVQHKFKEIHTGGADAELFEKTFAEGHGRFHEIPAGEFIDFLAKRGIASPKTDMVQLLGMDLGGSTGVTLFASNPASGFSASDWIPLHRAEDGKWRRLEVRPEGGKFVFFERFSCIRKIYGRKFLVCLTQDAPRKSILSFYHISADKVCGFELRDIEVDGRDVVIDSPQAREDYEFIAALELDFEEDAKDFHFTLMPKSALVHDGGKLSIPDGIEIIRPERIVEIALPEGNARTQQFKRLWAESEK